MWNLPTPPPPDISAPPALAAGVGAVVVGLLLLAAGLKLKRLTGAMVGLGLGLLAAQPLAELVSADVNAVRIGMAIGLAMFGLIAAELLWGVIGAGLLASLAAGWALSYYAGQLPPETAPAFELADEADLAQWAWAVGDYTRRTALAVWQQHRVGLGVVVGSATVAALAAGVFFCRLFTILTSASVGATLVISGAALAAIGVRPTLWPAMMGSLHVPAIAGGALAVLGAAFQALKLRQDRKKAEEKANGKKRKSKRKAPDKPLDQYNAADIERASES